MESAYTYVSVATAAPVHAVREHCLTDCTEGTVLLVRAVVVEARCFRPPAPLRRTSLGSEGDLLRCLPRPL
ncbi:hypothetical protein GCM10025864_28200 [Luteimicrobium album]|uniref:Uncharacterized protein n=1 Tax=Luteimicrobium album TaxID=1054550 RepID=A0ABQ6I2U7_9MICO|nr:hypothetical protein GCM10025864_28200 [Luteimicrobium album]